MGILLANGRVVTAEASFEADVLVEGEHIAAIGVGLGREGHEVIDASGCLILPGFIDVHTHLDTPFGGTITSDNYESGTRAALHGGTTTIIDFCIQPKGTPITKALDLWHEKSEGKALIDYSYHLAVSDPQLLNRSELERVVAEGVTSFKVFMAYKGDLQIDDETLFAVLRIAKDVGALVMVHAENGDVIHYLVHEHLRQGHTAPKFHAVTRPPEVEAEATARAIRLASWTETPLMIVHVSAKEALEEIKAARQRGQAVVAETCPQYLFLTEELYEAEGFEGAKYVCSPPLRSAEHQKALWMGLRLSHLQMVSSDHCPFFFKDQKELGRNDFSKIPNGVPGIELRGPLLVGAALDGRISLERCVQLLSTHPARVMGLYPRKGTLTIGSDADLVLVNPNVQRKVTAADLHENTDYTPYEGLTIRGRIEKVFSRGELVCDGGRCLGNPGRGRFLRRKQPDLMGVLS